MSESVLSVHHLNKHFGDRKVIDDLSFSIEKGDIYGFLGPNGSGKTTTIKMILGLIYPDSGSFTIMGRKLREDFKNTISKVGAIIETPRFYEGFNAYQNLKILSSFYPGLPQSRIVEVLDIVGLKSRARDKVRGFSLGMKQRLGIAGALLNKPEFVILDEPTNGLDPQGMKEIREMIVQLSTEQNITFFVSTHLLNEVEVICNKVAILKEGRMVAEGLVSELMEGETERMLVVTPDRQEAVARLQNIAFLKSVASIEQGVELTMEKGFSGEIIKHLVQHGVHVCYAYPKNRSLEAIFLDLTEGGSQVGEYDQSRAL